MAGNQNSGRRPLPANVHMLLGNRSKKSNAELAAAGGAEMVAAEAPTCPAFLTAPAKAEWKRIVDDLVALGLMSVLDRAEIAVYCQAWADWKHAREMIAKLAKNGDDAGYIEATPSGYKQMSSWMQIANRAEDRMRTAGASFGLNPSARSRLQLAPPQGELFPNDEKDKARKYFGAP